MYEKGVQTRNMIYQTAKQLFYDKGYEKTKIKEIADTAEVPIGLLPIISKPRIRLFSTFILSFLLRSVSASPKS